MTEVLLTDGGSFRMERDQSGQWIVKYSDGSWNVASDAEIAMWTILYNQGVV